jgi:hypothetical protein
MNTTHPTIKQYVDFEKCPLLSDRLIKMKRISIVETSWRNEGILNMAAG